MRRNGVHATQCMPEEMPPAQRLQMTRTSARSLPRVRRHTLDTNRLSPSWPLLLLLLCVLAILLPSLPSLVSGSSSTVCLASNCLSASSTFYKVYSDYDPKQIGYDYPVSLFDLFIALTVIVIALWVTLFAINSRHVWLLYDALRSGRVVRVPSIWSLVRHSITRDVIAQWMTRQEEAPPPAKVQKIAVPVHFPMASARLSVKVATATTAPPSASAPPPPPPAQEYTLRMTVSTTPHQPYMVEVWFGVPMKTVSLFLSDYTKFRARHATRARRRQQRKATVSPTTGGVYDGSVTAVAGGIISRRDASGGDVQMSTLTPRAPHRRPHATDVPPPQSSPPVSPILVAASRSKRPSWVTPQPYASEETGPRSPSPHSSPSHHAAGDPDLQSKHLSHLRLHERGSLSLVGSIRPTNGSGGAAPGLELLPPTKAGSCATPLPILAPPEGSQLFLPREALFTLPAAIYPPGTKQTVEVHFSQAWLRDTLADASRCPILIFVSAFGDATGTTTTTAPTSDPDSTKAPPVTGEITIVQFAPPASEAGVKTSKVAVLPAPAITQQVPEPKEEVANDDDAKEDDEAKDSDPLSSASPPAVGATGQQDAITTRAKFDRQLIITQDNAYEMEDLYGMDESDAECIICLTDIRDVILLPCKHVCVCQGCFKSINKCPICRARIHSHMCFTAPEPDVKPDVSVKEEVVPLASEVEVDAPAAPSAEAPQV